MPRLLSIVVGIVVFLASAVVIYFLSYFIVMARHVPSYENGKVKYESTFRFGALGDPVGPLSIPTGRACFINKIYVPADLIYYGYFDNRAGRTLPSANTN